MAVPRNRVSNARKNSRRAHMAKTPKVTTNCPSCGGVCLPHHVCTACGHYKGRLVIATAKE